MSLVERILFLLALAMAGLVIIIAAMSLPIGIGTFGISGSCIGGSAAILNKCRTWPICMQCAMKSSANPKLPTLEEAIQQT